MSPPSLNLSHCPLVVSPLLFARCVAIGESGFASSHIFIYSELNRHGISRKRENAENLNPVTDRHSGLHRQTLRSNSSETTTRRTQTRLLQAIMPIVVVDNRRICLSNLVHSIPYGYAVLGPFRPLGLWRDLTELLMTKMQDRAGAATIDGQQVRGSGPCLP